MDSVEQWRTVAECPNYQVSNFGNVRRAVASPFHPVGRLLKPMPDKNGYLKVHLYKNGQMFRRSIHRLVAMAFLGQPPDGFVVNHKDGCKKNNTPENLEYTTEFENKMHAKRTRLTPHGDRNGTRKHPEKVLRGENHPIAKHPELKRGILNGRAKISESQVIQIKLRLQNGESPTVIAQDFPISRELIYQIKAGRAWTHIQTS